ncbi:hypothetical protein JCM19052_3962 [Vibrio sp. JCM 19052]|nr:hypothetical protein JCM19052_3962 [Vibrio sp. JCM 19052]
MGTALASASAYKTIVEDEIASSGTFPAISAAFGIGNISATSSATGTGKITATVTQGGGKGQNVELTRSATGWTCSVSSALSITGCS